MIYLKVNNYYIIKSNYTNIFCLLSLSCINIFFSFLIKFFSLAIYLFKFSLLIFINMNLILSKYSFKYGILLGLL